MTKTIRNPDIDGTQLRLSVQRALLGVIGVQVLGVCVTTSKDRDNVIVNVFVEGFLSTDEQEAFDIAATEIMADFSPKISVDVQIAQNSKSPLKCLGVWVFVRYGCQII